MEIDLNKISNWLNLKKNRNCQKANNVLIIINTTTIRKSLCILNELFMKHSDDNIKNTFKTSSKRSCSIGTEELIIIMRMNIFINRLIFNGCGFDL